MLERVGIGDEGASADLLDLVYDQLLALGKLVYRDRAGACPSLQPTVLVHDAFLKLVDRQAAWDSRQHFFAVAAKAMRQLLADHARSRGTIKRGGVWDRVSLTGVEASEATDEVDVVELDAALGKLSALSERQARVVELRFLAGRTVEEVVEILGVSRATVMNDWRVARAFLRRELRRS